MTTIDRVKFDGTSGVSPLRISVMGVDVSGAEFNTLIFDANQSPLRLWANGFMNIPGITDNDFIGGKNVQEQASGITFSTVSGNPPTFLIMHKRSDGPGGNPNGNLITPYFGSREGGGGGMCSNQFVGANFLVGIPGSGGNPGPTNYVNYAVFKNDI